MTAARAWWLLLVLACLALLAPATLLTRFGLAQVLAPAGTAHDAAHSLLHPPHAFGLALGAACGRLLETSGHPGAALAGLGAGLLLAGAFAATAVRLVRHVAALRRLGGELARRRTLRLPAKARAALRQVGLAQCAAMIRAAAPEAFCYGWVHPRVAITTGLVRLLSPQELAAVLWHERDHVERRAPLRRLLGRLAAAAGFYVPLARDLARYAEVADELAADRRAVAALGSPVPLASALYKLLRAGTGEDLVGVAAAAPFWRRRSGAGGLGPASPAGVTATRIDQLTGRPISPWAWLSPAGLACSLAVAAATVCLLLYL